ncbi:hypothetical protein GCM10009037_10480 [Halarchaeum grantii]|uniref:GtrA/DPMS transmembrane domain-containing protein n=1 Tax=Halarchaeum grantii TaxID=1193105 RepID=A0A830EVH5_9EURY|nr:GtrA family protein [Halarchaeum grantii]GGL28754.1 hypothetical protein GCM10009037_10480 [Halarchaeum grantii]
MPSIRRVAAALLQPARAGQFLAVGALGALLDNAALVVLHDVLAFGLLPAKLVAAEASIILMFAVNERWTFDSWGARGVRALARRLLTSNAVRAVGLATGIAVLFALTRAGVWYLAANVVGLGVGFVVNYCFENVLTWRVLAG